MEVVWYEKTVEYKFVFLAKGFWGVDLLSPLAGNPEVTGDAIVSASNRYYIIEFKRDYESIVSEYKKYKNEAIGFKKSLKRMTKNQDWQSHYIIYGHYNPKTKIFGIEIDRYFGVFNLDLRAEEDFFLGGMSLPQLNKYVTQLTACKNGFYDDDGSGGSGVGLAIDDTTEVQVLAIDANNVATITTFEYIKKLQKDLKEVPANKEKSSKEQAIVEASNEKHEIDKHLKELDSKNKKNGMGKSMHS
ncbi:hypothetical protein C7431_103347 [Pantoea allii]|uniref:Uncharacterized protein n=1 Tax=Pantoea allii TaxID=574096 RepID=A0A2V2BIQ3_9GAMM|nr:hypothetical protein [Pantoea allii]PWK98577.1 hypothetical protein C7431_103347 [Pantoea allii]